MLISISSSAFAFSFGISFFFVALSVLLQVLLHILLSLYCLLPFHLIYMWYIIFIYFPPHLDRSHCRQRGELFISDVETSFQTEQTYFILFLEYQ